MFASRLRKLLALVFTFSSVIVPAASASSIPLALNNTWIVLEGGNRANPMDPGEFFNAGLNTDAAATIATADKWTWTSALNVKLTVTDWAIASDSFALYDNGVLFATVANGTDWQNIASCTPRTEDCHFTPVDPAASAATQQAEVNAAFADPVFAHGTFVLAPGSHSIQIQSTHIPFQEFLFGTANQSLQFSSTVAFRAATTTDPVTPTPAPEPGSLVLLGSGCLGWIAHMKRKRSIARQTI